MKTYQYISLLLGMLATLYINFHRINHSNESSSRRLSVDKSSSIELHLATSKEEVQKNNKNKFAEKKAENIAVLGSEKMRVLYEDARNQRLLDTYSSVYWSNVVVVMLIYDNPLVNNLVRAHFDSWLKRTSKGLDVVLVTDEDDMRTDEEIVPEIKNIKTNITVLRSSKTHEGKRARAKVVDAFSQTMDIFSSNKRKTYFVKVDPDSFVFEEVLLAKLNLIHQNTFPAPVDFGYVICNNVVSCYSEGGMYGFNREGLRNTLNYILKHPQLYEHQVVSRYDPSIQINVHEDFFTSYAFHKATGLPITKVKEIAHLIDFLKEGTKVNPVSIHPIKSIREFYATDLIFYKGNGERRSLLASLQLLSANQHILDFTRFEWDSSKEMFIVKN